MSQQQRRAEFIRKQLERQTGFGSATCVTSNGDGGYDVQAGNRAAPWSSVGASIDLVFAPNDRLLIATSGERDMPVIVGLHPWVTEGQISETTI